MTTEPEHGDADHRLHTAQKRYRHPPGGREIILVRHGSAGGLTVDVRLPFGEITLSDPPLWPEGHAQAEAVGLRLAREKISQIFVTPLQRTHQTAAPLARLTGLTPIVVPDLREVYMGDYEHGFYARAAKGDPLLTRMMTEETFEILPNAEPADGFVARIRAGILKIVELMEPGTVAASFSHAGTIGEICRQATDSRPFAFMGPENGSISRLVIHADGRWTLRSFNDVTHLG
jgi:probable phosphoglycerate mutase